jgi:hypothetical protein
MADALLLSNCFSRPLDNTVEASYFYTSVSSDTKLTGAPTGRPGLETSSVVLPWVVFVPYFIMTLKTLILFGNTHPSHYVEFPRHDFASMADSAGCDADGLVEGTTVLMTSEKTMLARNGRDVHP